MEKSTCSEETWEGGNPAPDKELVFNKTSGRGLETRRHACAGEPSRVPACQLQSSVQSPGLRTRLKATRHSLCQGTKGTAKGETEEDGERRPSKGTDEKGELTSPLCAPKAACPHLLFSPWELQKQVLCLPHLFCVNSKT